MTTWAPDGLLCRLVTVEVAARPGLSSFIIVGLAGRSVTESKERVRLALRRCGVKLPATSIVINLSPVELAKHGSHYDLPIALALLKATGELSSAQLPVSVGVVGELSLTGRLRPVPRAVSFALAAQKERRRLVGPAASRHEIALAGGLTSILADDLPQLLEQLRAGRWQRLKETTGSQMDGNQPANADGPIFDDIVGQDLAKRAAIISMAGGHNLLLFGPPGVGKSLLATAAHRLLPPLSQEERREVAELYSAAGQLTGGPLSNPPFRAPHHLITAVALTGGGALPRPGELSLAHRGVLFLDELPLFTPAALEVLREPLENGFVTVSRARQSWRFPARAIVVGAGNPCPCGYFGSDHPCQCTPLSVRRYRQRLSGPLLDRCALFVHVGAVGRLPEPGGDAEHRAAVESVSRARFRQQQRGMGLNGYLPAAAIRQQLAAAKLNGAAEQYLNSQSLSMRRLFNLARVALTISDLAGQPLSANHLTEAMLLLPPARLAEG